MADHIADQLVQCDTQLFRRFPFFAAAKVLVE